MKAYELTEDENTEYFTNKDKAIKAYSEIGEHYKTLDLVEIKTPNAKLVIDILNGLSGYIVSRTPIAAWTMASGEIYKRED